MSFFGDFNNKVQIYRYTDILYKGDASTTTNVLSPGSSAYIQVLLSSSQTGSIYLNGNVGENITFSSIDFKESSSAFTALNGITPSGLTGAITLKAVNKSGKPVMSLPSQPLAELSCCLRPQDNRILYQVQGMIDKYTAELFVEPDTEIVVNDQLKIDGEGYYPVIASSMIKGSDGMNSHQYVLIKGV